MKIRSIAMVICLVAMSASLNVFAQGPQEGPRPARERMGGREPMIVPPVVMSGTHFDGDRFIYVGSEMSFDGKIVKGAPYSAVAVNESIQVLSDGNRIVRKTTASVYRDSEGRTRREQSLAGIGPYASQRDLPQTVFIHDPIAQVNYILEPGKNTARKISTVRIESKRAHEDEIKKKMLHESGATEAGERAKIEWLAQGGAGERRSVNITTSVGQSVELRKKSSNTEELGKQMIEGVEAEGTRVTFTIPAGEIGNEAPINVVSERWYSPELQAVVMTRQSDPRSGEMTYRLTNINRSEPARSLFEVPADYTIKEEEMNFDMKIRIDKELQKVEEMRKKKDGSL